MKYLAWIFLLMMFFSGCNKTSSTSADKEPASEIDAVDWNSLTLETDYHYNIALKKKDFEKRVTRILGDSALKSRTSSDMYEYIIKEVIEKSDEKIVLLVSGGNIISDPMNYTFTISNGYIQVERMKNGAKWWFISESTKDAFEKELEEAGLLFHKL